MTNGVVLFADDHVHQSDYAEYELYKLFRNEFVVLTVDNLDHLEQALMSVSSFDVIILDWEFLENDPDFADLPARNPLSILEKLKLFSKIFIYSNSIIPDSDQNKLRRLFPDRVEFKKKNLKPGQVEELLAEFTLIKSELDEFSSRNKNLNFTVAWSRAINQSLQEIFGELSEASSSWLRDLYETSLDDNGNPVWEIIELLNNLLAEQLVQHPVLSASIESHAALPKAEADQDIASAKLFQRVYYTKIHNPTVSISTGDIFDISDQQYAILITPECEIYSHGGQSSVLKERLDVLLFSKGDILKEFSKPKPTELSQLGKFNQNSQSKHILPSFPYLNENKLLPGIIDFTTALRTVPRRWLTRKSRRFKLNSPYIQQLRQRFSSSHGRVGVPAVNNSVKVFNITQIKALKDDQEVTAKKTASAEKEMGPTSQAVPTLQTKKEASPANQSSAGIKVEEKEVSSTNPTVSTQQTGTEVTPTSQLLSEAQVEKQAIVVDRSTSIKQDTPKESTSNQAPPKGQIDLEAD